MTQYLFLLTGNEGDQAVEGGLVQFETDDNAEWSGFVADYRATMTTLLETYLTNITEWSNEVLGLEFSQQVGYNLPVDMLQVIPAVNTPETETLSFANNVDAFRQFCGAANLAGRSVISIELGAAILLTYNQTWTGSSCRRKTCICGGRHPGSRPRSCVLA